MVLALISIFIIGYTCIALEHPLKVNKTATALHCGPFSHSAISSSAQTSISSSGGRSYQAI